MITKDRVLLTDAEVDDIVAPNWMEKPYNDRLRECSSVAKAEAKKFLGLLDEPCGHNRFKTIQLRKGDCRLCMAEIHEVVDGR